MKLRNLTGGYKLSKNIPAVSIVIPMYTAEKYIGECLDSILAQTFQDFEVIVVDDCSTDKSCDVVESYLPKFNREGIDRFKFFRSEKNSDSCPGIPRNIGIRFANGEYLMFVDSDDGIIKSAVGTLYDIAKKLDADIVSFQNYYTVVNGETFNTDEQYLKQKIHETKDSEKEFIILSEDVDGRVKDLINNKFFLVPWTFIFRRSLILKYDIKFPAIRGGEDSVFDFWALCTAKRLVMTFKRFYVHRMLSDSHSNMRNLHPEKVIHQYGSVVLKEIGIYDELMNDLEIFNKHPTYKYAILDYIVWIHLSSILPLYTKIPVYKLDELIRQELSKINNTTALTALTAFLFSRMNISNITKNQYGEIIQQLNDYIQQANAHIQKQNQIIQQQQEQIQQLQAQLNSGKE